MWGANQSSGSTLPFQECLTLQYSFTADYMKNPTGGGGEAAGSLYKNSHQSLEEKYPSALFHLYAVLQHPAHKAAGMPTLTCKILLPERLNSSENAASSKSQTPGIIGREHSSMQIREETECHTTEARQTSATNEVAGGKFEQSL